MGPPMLSAKKSPTRRDAKRSSTNTAPTLEDMLMLDLLSNVKLMLKLTHKFSVMVDSTTDSAMLDMPTPPLLPSPSPPPSPRPSRLPALRSDTKSILTVRQGHRIKHNFSTDIPATGPGQQLS